MYLGKYYIINIRFISKTLKFVIPVVNLIYIDYKNQNIFIFETPSPKHVSYQLWLKLA